MNILDRIVETKKAEVAAAKRDFPLSRLRDSAYYHAISPSVSKMLQAAENSRVIAEFKRQSPSKGLINGISDPVDVARGYALQGAAAVSVLTDQQYFGGSLQDFDRVRKAINIPLLRKDFIIDSYQIHESKSHGADIVLLIAAILSPAQVAELAQEARSLGMEVLLELHAEDELKHVCTEANLVGVNNRNLKSFEVNIEHSIRMQQMLPAGVLKIAESGIHSTTIAAQLLQNGFDGLLMGEYFMKQPQPAEAFSIFVNQLKETVTNYAI
jgi:indole-3-glycerol phosphate synthase